MLVRANSKRSAIGISSSPSATSASPPGDRRLESTLGPHEALDRISQHEQIRLPVRRVILDDLLWRDLNPLIVQPGVPAIFWIPLVAGLDFEFRPHGVSDTTAKKGLFISIWVLVIVGPLEALKPSLVRPVWPFAAGKKL